MNQQRFTRSIHPVWSRAVRHVGGIKGVTPICSSSETDYTEPVHVQPPPPLSAFRNPPPWHAHKRSPDRSDTSEAGGWRRDNISAQNEIKLYPSLQLNRKERGGGANRRRRRRRRADRRERVRRCALHVRKNTAAAPTSSEPQRQPERQILGSEKQ